MESSRAIVDSEKYFVVQSISALIELSGCAMIKFE